MFFATSAFRVRLGKTRLVSISTTITAPMTQALRPRIAHTVPAMRLGLVVVESFAPSGRGLAGGRRRKPGDGGGLPRARGLGWWVVDRFHPRDRGLPSGRRRSRGDAGGCRSA